MGMGMGGENGATTRSKEWCFGKDSVIKAIEAVGRGELIVVVDDESRENEGDLIMVRATLRPDNKQRGSLTKGEFPGCCTHILSCFDTSTMW